MEARATLPLLCPQPNSALRAQAHDLPTTYRTHHPIDVRSLHAPSSRHPLIVTHLWDFPAQLT